MNKKLHAWTVGIGAASMKLRKEKNRKMSRECLSAQVGVCAATIIRWENRDDPQMLFRCQVDSFSEVYKKEMNVKPRVYMFDTKEAAENFMKKEEEKKAKREAAKTKKRPAKTEKRQVKTKKRYTKKRVVKKRTAK